MDNPGSEIVGPMFAQAAVFVFKSDSTVSKAMEDVKNMNDKQGGIRGEIHCDKASFLDGLQRWNSQVDPTSAFLCIYSHAGISGIAAAPDGPIVTWEEIAAALPKSVQYLWLLGCDTSAAIDAWKDRSPVLHRILVTTEGAPWRPFLKFFAYEISATSITFDDEMHAALTKVSPAMAASTTYFDGRFRRVPHV